LEQSRIDLLLWVLQAFELELQREYTEHYLCKQVLIFVFLQTMHYLDRELSDLHFDSVQIRMLKDVESLKDVTVRFGYVFF
jgi:hypothetical protein